MNYTLSGIEQLFIAPVTGDTLNYFVNSGDTIIASSINFSKIDFDSASFSQSRTVDTKGIYFNKSFDFVTANISDTTVLDFDQSLAVLFQDNNGNWFLTGHEKPYSFDKADYSIDDSTNKIEFSINQSSYDKIQPVNQFWLNGSDAIQFPAGGSFNVPDHFTGVTGGSIHLSWINKPYSVQYDSFNLVRTNPAGHPSGTTNNFFVGMTSTGLTQTPDYYYGGQYKYKIALAKNGSTYQFSNTISVNTYNPNLVLNLTGHTSGNNIVLTWSNRNYKFPYQGFVIKRTNPVGHPSGATTFLSAASGVTTYTDVNVGQYSDLEDLGTYKYEIAIKDSTGRINQYNNQATILIHNFNVPQSLATSVTGNSIVLTWTNPTYSITVQSFSISRLRDLGGGNWGDAHLFTVNNNGSLTKWIDSNIGAAGDYCYEYQINVAKLPNGFDGQTYTFPPVEQCITNVNIPPKLAFNGGLYQRSYFGGQYTAPVLTISGGSGTVTVKSHMRFDNSNYTITDYPVTANGTIQTHTDPANGKFYGRLGFNPAFILDPNGGAYLLGNTGGTLIVLPAHPTGKVSGMTVNQVGSNVVIDWGEYKDDPSVLTFGYTVGRFAGGDFGTKVDLWVTGITNTAYTDVAPAPGLYTYYVIARSVYESTTIMPTEGTQYYANPTYPDMIDITVV